MSYRLINANSIVFNSDGFITAENIEKMPCIYADLPNGMDGEHYVLEQQPCDDAISRQAVLDINENHHGQMPNHVNHEIWNEIKALPSVTPKEKTGHWIDDEFGSKCSCCGIHTHLDKFDRPMKFKCCSMCGAKMQEAEE